MKDEQKGGKAPPPHQPTDEEWEARISAATDATAEDHGELDAWNESDARNLPQPPATDATAEHYPYGMPDESEREPEASQRPRKDAQEWTPHWERVGDIDYYIPKATCDKHNTALAAEREQRSLDANQAIATIAELEQQLAAERETTRLAIEVRAEELEAEKRKPLVDALEMLSYDGDGVPVTWPSQQTRDDALAKVKQ